MWVPFLNWLVLIKGPQRSHRAGVADGIPGGLPSADEVRRRGGCVAGLAAALAVARAGHSAVVLERDAVEQDLAIKLRGPPQPGDEDLVYRWV
jgi:hypothetical protein